MRPPRYRGDMADRTKTPLVPRLIARALSWRIVRAYLRYSERRGPLLADSVTYRTLFSVFAGVLLGFSVAALWLAGNPQAWQGLIDAVDGVIPGLVGEGGIIDPEKLGQPIAFSLAGVFSLVGLVLAAIGAIGSLRTSLRVIADKVHDDTLFIIVLGRNLVLAVVIGVGLAAAAAATVLGTAGVGLVADVLGVSADSPVTVGLSAAVGILVTFVLDTAVVALLFRTLSGVRAPARALWTGALLGFIWGGLVRVFLVHHLTWSINSVCHIWGFKSFQSHDQSRNNFIFGVLAFGEGWHNNHHAFPTSARHGLSWWQLDVSYLVVRAMSLFGLARNIRVPRPERLEAKRVRPAA